MIKLLPELESHEPNKSTNISWVNNVIWPYKERFPLRRPKFSEEIQEYSGGEFEHITWFKLFRNSEETKRWIRCEPHIALAQGIANAHEGRKYF